MQTTHEGAAAYEHSLDHALEFFSKAGSLFEGSRSFYGGQESALSLFQKTWIVDSELSLRLLFWLRDPRGGAGNRSSFRSCLKWLAGHEPAYVQANIHLIPEFGRWDDLTVLYDTPCESAALELWAGAIRAAEPGSLACKWAGRRDNKLRKYMELTPKAYRQLLVKNTQVVETPMCAGEWGRVEYPGVPSVAMARYTKAFGRHDAARFEAYKTAVAAGEETVNAAVLFPHDCVRTAKYGDRDMADLQFQALPNFLAGTDRRILCLCDSSGSMGVRIAGSIQAIDVSTSLSLYCSDRLPQDSPFYRKFLQFEDESHLSDWSGLGFSAVVRGESRIFNGAVGATNIHKALDGLLAYAKMFKATPSQMPNTLLIISDMQFTQGVAPAGQTEVEAALERWADAGYDQPTVIYWNTAGYAGSPATVKSSNVALVSGFSPAILQAVLGGQDVSPQAVLLRALEKYVVEAPTH